MFTVSELAMFSLAALVLMLTPGPNMLYCLSRTLGQGRRAGLMSRSEAWLRAQRVVMASVLGLLALRIATDGRKG